MPPSLARALPRIGLLGNPSDGYDGRVIGFTFRDFAVRVCVDDAPRFDFGGCVVDSWGEVVGRMPALEGGAGLLVAATKKFLDHCHAVGHSSVRTAWDDAPFRVSFDSDIPRQVGLAGSSAIIIATLRALAVRFEIAIAPHDLAELALAAETEELGIAAGPQDRVIQSYEGLLAMDFRAPRCPQQYERLPERWLPPLYIAWDPRGAVCSGVVHDDVRERWNRGDRDVRDAMARFPALAAEGRRCLESGDHAWLRDLMNDNFDTRAAIWPISDRDRELVAIGRALGAGVKFCGSGGGVVGVPPPEVRFEELAARYRDAGYTVLRPNAAAADGEAQTA